MRLYRVFGAAVRVKILGTYLLSFSQDRTRHPPSHGSKASMDMVILSTK